VLRQHAGHDLINGVHHLEELVVGQVLEGELALARVARVRLAQNRVPEARDDLARVQRLPGELRNGLFVDGLALGVELGLEVLDPS
jgi:hypothetical protein